MPKKNEHFKPAIIRKLKDRVNHLCSRPTCQAQTSGPASEGKVNTVGTAAHICARSPNGPRYKASQTFEERHSFDNAIWLCNICAREIDLDPNLFTENVLQQWKCDAEERASLALGRRIPPEQDLPATIVAALTGSAPKPLYNAIHNIHQASNKAYEKIDPRFKAESEYINGVQMVTFFAKENVHLSMKPSPEYIDELANNTLNLLEHGKGFAINLSDVSIVGSPIFEENFDNGFMKVIPHGTEARQKIILRDPVTGQFDFADDIVGMVTSGQKSFSFSGSAFEGILNMEYVYPVKSHDKNVDMTIGTNYNSWLGKELRTLQYLSKIQELFKKVAEGSGVETWLDTSNGIVFKADIGHIFSSASAITQHGFLKYVSMCKKIAEKLDLLVMFRDDIIVTLQEFEKLEKIVARFEGKIKVQADDLTSNPVCTMEIPIEKLPTFSGSMRGNLHWISPIVERITLFGVEAILPPLVLVLEDVQQRVIEVQEKTSLNVTIRVELTPGENFSFYETYHLTPIS